jgi:hypothetical protein
MTIRDEIAEKGCDARAIAAKIGKDKRLIREVLAGMGSEGAREKYGCEKVIRFISETNPAVIYPHFDEIVSYLDSDNSFLKWGAIITISNLACIDKADKIDSLFKKYFAPIMGNVMITAGNTIASGARIALAKPYLANKIAGEILKVRSAVYETEECRNVAIGHAIEAFSKIYDLVRDKKKLIEFITTQTRNTRKAVRIKVLKFISKHKPVETGKRERHEPR